VLACRAFVRRQPLHQRPRDARGLVVYRSSGDDRSAHDVTTCAAIARRLAALMGIGFAGHYESANMAGGSLYLVPMDTLVGIEHARSLGVRGEQDLFGGVVPYPFVATKSISHALVDERARAPEGWSDAFGRRVRDTVLPGFSAFCVDDAARGGLAMLAQGPVRIKRALGIGGRGQSVVRTRAGLEDALAETDAQEIERYGVSLELDLDDVTTFSVGQVRVDNLVASYCGTQSLTRNTRGQLVYGGSRLFVVRGDFDTLLARGPAPLVRCAIEQARCYDDAASACFDGFFASRRNYDVAQGIDSRGRRRSGVLEQSWRVGGASGAEVEALAAFRADPDLQGVAARTTEVYGEGHAAPSNATVYFDGDDSHGGRLLKYATIERHVHA
jgi:uncharacterized protein DUF3182